MMTTASRLAMAATAVVLLTGCAGGDGGGADLGGRPSADAIASAIEDGVSGLPASPTQADCAAKLVVESDMSDAAIGRYVGEGNPGYVDPDDYAFTQRDRDAFDELSRDLASECDVQQGAG